MLKVSVTSWLDVAGRMIFDIYEASPLKKSSNFTSKSLKNIAGDTKVMLMI